MRVSGEVEKPIVRDLKENVSEPLKEDSESPLDNLPSYIRQLTYFGEREGWSHDDKQILFLEKTFGDVYESELATGIIRPMTHHTYNLFR